MVELGDGEISFDNSLIAVPSSIIALTVLGMISFDLWIYMFSVAVSWVIADVLLGLIIRGGSGIVQIPPTSETSIVTKGHAYIAFLIAIFVATLLSTILSDAVFQLAGLVISATASRAGLIVSQAQAGMMTVFICSALVGLLVFADLETRFYDRDDS